MIQRPAPGTSAQEVLQILHKIEAHVENLFQRGVVNYVKQQLAAPTDFIRPTAAQQLLDDLCSLRRIREEFQDLLADTLAFPPSAPKAEGPSPTPPTELEEDLTPEDADNPTANLLAFNPN